MAMGKVNFFKKKRKIDEHNGMSISYAPGKRNANKKRWYGLVFLMSLPVIWFVYSIMQEYLDINARGTITFPTLTVYSK